MANVLTPLVPKILAMALLTLRENAIMPRMVNRAYSPAPGQKGSTVDVPIPPVVGSRAVLSSTADPTNPPDLLPTTVPIKMDQWYESIFTLNDKERNEVTNDIIPMALAEAAKSLANRVDQYLLGMGDYFYSGVGTAGTTPFNGGTIDNAVDAKVKLDQQLAPVNDRGVVLDPIAQGNFLKVAGFRDWSQSNDASRIKEGSMGRALGFDWFMDQNVGSHTSGTATGLTVGTAGAAVGDTTVPISASGAGTLVLGDIITYANHTQQYRVVATVTVGTNTVTTIYPALLVAQVSTNVITRVATHVMNLAFHRDAIAFATRPLEGIVESGLGSIVQSMTDQVSGLTMRLEIKRQYRQTLFALDMLYGASVIRPQYGTRIFG